MLIACIAALAYAIFRLIFPLPGHLGFVEYLRTDWMIILMVIACFAIGPALARGIQRSVVGTVAADDAGRMKSVVTRLRTIGIALSVLGIGFLAGGFYLTTSHLLILPSLTFLSPAVLAFVTAAWVQTDARVRKAQLQRQRGMT
jgi:hypothetical protein